MAKKGDADLATQSADFQQQEDLYQIGEPNVKIIYLDKEVSSHSDETPQNPMDVHDEQ